MNQKKKKSILREYLSAQTAISLTIYMVSYLIKCFVLFRFENPLMWVMNIPDYTPETRAIILICYLSLSLCLLAIVSSKKADLNNMEPENCINNRSL